MVSIGNADRLVPRLRDHGVGHVDDPVGDGVDSPQPVARLGQTHQRGDLCRRVSLGVGLIGHLRLRDEGTGCRVDHQLLAGVAHDEKQVARGRRHVDRTVGRLERTERDPEFGAPQGEGRRSTHAVRHCDGWLHVVLRLSRRRRGVGNEFIDLGKLARRRGRDLGKLDRRGGHVRSLDFGQRKRVSFSGFRVDDHDATQTGVRFVSHRPVGRRGHRRSGDGVELLARRVEVDPDHDLLIIETPNRIQAPNRHGIGGGLKRIPEVEPP